MKADPTSVDKAPSAAGRPRDPRIDAAILRATTDLLVEIGYSNLTMAAVADRAGTTKTALYRRWSSKAELVHEAAFPAAPTAIGAPPGDFRADVGAMIAATRDVFTSPVVRAALPGLIADMAADAELNTRVMSRFTDLFAAVRTRLAEAVRARRGARRYRPGSADRGDRRRDDAAVAAVAGPGTRRRMGRPDDRHRRPRCDCLTLVVHQPFPTDWRTALVLVPHPDDPEYGCAAAVAKWTSQGKHVYYALACRGEAGIPGHVAGGVRPAAGTRTAHVVGHRRRGRRGVLGLSRQPDLQYSRTPGEDRRDDHRTGARRGDHPLQRSGVGAGSAEPARPHRVLQCRCRRLRFAAEQAAVVLRERSTRHARGSGRRFHRCRGRVAGRPRRLPVGVRPRRAGRGAGQDSGRSDDAAAAARLRGPPVGRVHPETWPASRGSICFLLRSDTARN